VSGGLDTSLTGKSPHAPSAAIVKRRKYSTEMERAHTDGQI
jgi:hypothetical protein